MWPILTLYWIREGHYEGCWGIIFFSRWCIHHDTWGEPGEVYKPFNIKWSRMTADGGFVENQPSEYEANDEFDYVPMTKRACKTCGEVVEMADHWWEFISWNCEPCEYKDIEAKRVSGHWDGSEPF